MNGPKGNLLFLLSMTRRDEFFHTASIAMVSRQTYGREQVKEVQNRSTRLERVSLFLTARPFAYLERNLYDNISSSASPPFYVGWRDKTSKAQRRSLCVLFTEACEQTSKWGVGQKPRAERSQSRSGAALYLTWDPVHRLFITTTISKHGTLVVNVFRKFCFLK